MSTPYHIKSGNLYLASLAIEIKYLLIQCYKEKKGKLEDDDFELIDDGLEYFRYIEKGHQICPDGRGGILKNTKGLSLQYILNVLDKLEDVEDVVNLNDVVDINVTLFNLLEHKEDLYSFVQKEKEELKSMIDLFDKICDYAMNFKYIGLKGDEFNWVSLKRFKRGLNYE